MKKTPLALALGGLVLTGCATASAAAAPKPPPPTLLRMGGGGTKTSATFSVGSGPVTARYWFNCGSAETGFVVVALTHGNSNETVGGATGDSGSGVTTVIPVYPYYRVTVDAYGCKWKVWISNGSTS